MDIRALANLALTPVEYFNDWLRAIRWSKASPICPDRLQLQYDIILLAHTVEKGLSVEKPRHGFGREKISKLLFFLDKYDASWGSFPLEKSYGCLQEYRNWHASIGYELGEFGGDIDRFLDRCRALQINPKGGVKNIENSGFYPNLEFENALLNRFSCRRFEPKIVSDDLLCRIGSISIRTPSQCNRQSSRVHYYSDKTKIDALLKLQGGAEGFRESVYNLFVISSELSAWSGIKARSQAYVDGALTAMQVLNACQALGLGSCPLNLAVMNSKEKSICKVGGISTGERLIVMIAFGYPVEASISVARSERLPIDSVLVRH